MASTVFFTQMDKALILASIDIYRAEIREACLEDQGTPEGAPNTVGRRVQTDLSELRSKVEREIIGY